MIREEIGKGRLVLDKSGTSVLISRDREKLEEILNNFGENMSPALRERFEELARGRIPVGAR